MECLSKVIKARQNESGVVVVVIQCVTCLSGEDEEDEATIEERGDRKQEWKWKKKSFERLSVMTMLSFFKTVWT